MLRPGAAEHERDRAIRDIFGRGHILPRNFVKAADGFLARARNGKTAV